MNYDLNKNKATGKPSVFAAAKTLWPLISSEKIAIIGALIAVLINSTLSLIAPKLSSTAIDKHLLVQDYPGVVRFAWIIFGVYFLGLATSYLQIRLMGGVGQRVLFSLRDAVFRKLQELPLSFFGQNKAGDLISRINSDTEKINQFFSQSLVQFVGNLVVMIGSSVFLLALNWKLGIVVLTPAVLVVLVSLVVSRYVGKLNSAGAKAGGNLSSEVSESLANFKVVVAFNRRDYFKNRFMQVNNESFSASLYAAIANGTYMPLYTFASNLGQLAILVYGIYLISIGEFSVGLLVGYLAYASFFYNPMRQLASLWAGFQSAIASWDRVHDLLLLESDLKLTTENSRFDETSPLLAFEDVSFGYTEEEMVLANVNLSFEKGKTYALIGPTGGGKTTTASLMAHQFSFLCH
jgi:ATP-binding cassette subfamily B protein